MRKTVLFGVIVGLFFGGCNPQHKKIQNIEEHKVDGPVVKKQDSASSATGTYDSFGLQIDSLQVEEHKVKQNESLYVILDKLNFDAQEIYSITQQAREHVDVQSLKPGQKYRVYTKADSSQQISHMLWQPNPIEYVVFDWQQDSLQIFKAARALTSKTAAASGVINNSLYQTVSDAGASQLLAYKLANVFAWQINFFGLREGDSFKALYNKKFIDGEYYGIGEILAAEFTHRGETYRAYKFNYEGTDGYFTESGESVQKALLKVPFEYSQRISSRFSNSRYHPILKRRMPHHGVDFAAPYGTPVLSVGDGTVTEAQYRGANGNIVKITHNSTYRTAYLHLKGFARGIHRGAKVKQGQVIGYVGNTGRSTGSHLDYRLYRNDHAVNPMAVELPSSDAVPDSLIGAFRRVRDSLESELKSKLDGDQREEPVLTEAK